MWFSTIKGIKEKVVTEACKLGLVNNTLDDYGESNGSSLINGLLYYYISPILNMDKDEKVIKEMVDTLSENGIEESQPPITGTIHLKRQHVFGGRGVPMCRWSKGHST